jgi:hypothetical protein
MLGLAGLGTRCVATEKLTAGSTFSNFYNTGPTSVPDKPSVLLLGLKR